MLYDIIYTINGHRTFDSQESLIDYCKCNGYEHKGFNRNTWHRQELQEQPIFDGLAGPLWDGDKYAMKLGMYLKGYQNDLL